MDLSPGYLVVSVLFDAPHLLQWQYHNRLPLHRNRRSRGVGSNSMITLMLLGSGQEKFEVRQPFRSQLISGGK
jgi:hypothetical protein